MYNHYLKNTNYSWGEKGNMQELIHIAQIMAQGSGQSMYILDLLHLKFSYVSDNSLFLCGYSPRNVKRMSTLFYKKVVHPEDLDLIMHISMESLGIFGQYSKEEASSLVMSYDFRIINPFNRQIRMIHHRFIPIHFTPEGRIADGACFVFPSTKMTAGHAEIRLDGVKPIYQYIEGKGWIAFKQVNPVTLTDRERQILSITIQGYNNKEIADLLSIDINTVKAHKKNIFKKLKVRNIAEAIIYASNESLL